MMAWIVLGSALGGLSVWFALAWYRALSVERSKTSTQRRQDAIEAALSAQRKESLAEKATAWARRYGWTAAPAPLLVGVLVLYLATAIGLALVGITGWFGVVVAVPVSFGVVSLVAANAQARRRRLFQAELLDAFDQFAAAVRTSSSPSRAIEDQVPSLPEPLRSELSAAMDRHRAGQPLSQAMAELADRYPSRAMNLFVIALRINDQGGGKLAKPLEEAAEVLRKDSELTSEAKAELAQDRLQFFGILGILGLIAFTTLTQSGPESLEAYTSPLGLTVLVLAFANAAFGVVRVLRMIARTNGEML